MNEQDNIRAGYSYIENLYNEIKGLSICWVNYDNQMHLLKSSLGTKHPDEVNLTDADNAQLLVLLQQVRGMVKLVWSDYVPIKDKLQTKNYEEIKKYYEKLIEQKIIDIADIETFIIEIKKILVDSTLQTLLTSALDITRQIYENAPGK